MKVFAASALLLLGTPTLGLAETSAPVTTQAFASASGRLERLAEDAFAVHLVNDNADDTLADTFRAWWYVRLDDVPTQMDTSLFVDNISFAEPYLPSYSYDQQTWHHVKVEDVERADTATLRVRKRFARSTVWLARRQPYGEAQQAQLLADLQGAAEGRTDLAYEARVLGPSPQGRPLYLVSVTAGTANAAKKRVWVHARTHPGETQSSWMADGLLRFLLSDEPEARAVRARYIVHVVPIHNVDGVALGNYRTNAASENLESLWDAPAPPQEIALLHEAIAQLAHEGPAFSMAFNLHSSHEEVQQPAFGFPHFGPASLGYGEAEASLWTRQVAFGEAVQRAYAPRPFAVGRDDLAAPAPKGRGFLDVPMPERWWWRRHGSSVMATTVEAVDGQVGLGGRWADVEDFQALGAALGKALLDER